MGGIFIRGVWVPHLQSIGKPLAVGKWSSYDMWLSNECKKKLEVETWTLISLITNNLRDVD